MGGKCRAGNAPKLPAKCELRPEQWGSMDRNRDDTTHLTNSWLANYNGLSTTNPAWGRHRERCAGPQVLGWIKARGETAG